MWFAIVGKRTLHGTTARTRSPAAKPVASEEERLVVAEAVRRRRSVGDGARLVVGSSSPCVGHLAAAVGVERRLAQLREEEPVAELLERAELR